MAKRQMTDEELKAYRALLMTDEEVNAYCALFLTGTHCECGGKHRYYAVPSWKGAYYCETCERSGGTQDEWGRWDEWERWFEIMAGFPFPYHI